MASPHVDIETGNHNNNHGPLEVDLMSDPENTGKGFLKPLPETTLLERVAGGAAAASVMTALAAMILEGGAVVVVGGVLSAIVGPYVYYQQTQLTDIKALQETQQKIQIEGGLPVRQDIRTVTLSIREDTHNTMPMSFFFATHRFLLEIHSGSSCRGK